MESGDGAGPPVEQGSGGMGAAAKRGTESAKRGTGLESRTGQGRVDDRGGNFALELLKMERQWGGLGNEISVSMPSVHTRPNRVENCSTMRYLGESGVVCVEISLPLGSEEEFGNGVLESVDGLERMDAAPKLGTKLRK